MDGPRAARASGSSIGANWAGGRDGGTAVRVDLGRLDDGCRGADPGQPDLAGDDAVDFFVPGSVGDVDPRAIGAPIGQARVGRAWPGDSGDYLGRNIPRGVRLRQVIRPRPGMVWEAVRLRQSSWPGRPSPQTASSVLLVAATVALTRLDRWTRVLWPVCLVGGAAIPLVTVAAYLFDAMALAGVSLVYRPGDLDGWRRCCCWSAAASLARSDRFPIAWLLARPDRRSLVRLAGMLATFPIIVALSRATFLGLGLGEQAGWTLSIVLGTAIVGAITFYLSQREQRLLIEKEAVSKQRADAEMRYRLLADNAVDIIVHLRGTEVAWISPSVEAALGGPAQQWIGPGFERRVHPDDLDTVAFALRRIAGGESVVQRFRVRSMDWGIPLGRWPRETLRRRGRRHRWADRGAAHHRRSGRGGAAARPVGPLRHPHRVGESGRGHGPPRAALEQPRASGTYVGVLFCDVDQFKNINDTWGHGIGDLVLVALAARICESVRAGDTVGRTGGDEILVLLPGINGVDEVAQIAEAIRCHAAEPIELSENAIYATLSIGATIALPGEHVSTITARADAAMYQAKSGTRNPVVQISA